MRAATTDSRSAGIGGADAERKDNVPSKPTKRFLGLFSGYIIRIAGKPQLRWMKASAHPIGFLSLAAAEGLSLDDPPRRPRTFRSAYQARSVSEDCTIIYLAYASRLDRDSARPVLRDRE